MEECRGTPKDGEPCTLTQGLSDDGLCMFHDPDRADEVSERARAGGKGRSQAFARKRARGPLPAPLAVPKAPKTLEDAVEWSSWAMHGVATGALDARSGHEIGYLVNAFKAAVEKRDLELEIRALRATIADLQKRPRGVA